ncbi:MAG: hypothetical protein WBD16_11300 [Pyrinomonadaceae bacterium]
MLDALKEIVKQPYWIIALIAGAILVAFPFITIDKEFYLQSHPPSALLPVIIGIFLLAVSLASFAFTLWSTHKKELLTAGGLDLSLVKESKGILSVTVGTCILRVAEGRIEDFPIRSEGTVVVLPCNEYFDDECARDKKSSLGAYVGKVFENQVDEFVSLVKTKAKENLGPGEEQQKSKNERAESFGAGRCLLLLKPLGRSVPIALVSTTIQRSDRGLNGRLSFLFDGIHDLCRCLAEKRLDRVVMPVLAGGHSGIHPPLAFVGLLLAITEALRYRPGGRGIEQLTVVVFRADDDSKPAVDNFIVRRALALVASRD